MLYQNLRVQITVFPRNFGNTNIQNSVEQCSSKKRKGLKVKAFGNAFELKQKNAVFREHIHSIVTISFGINLLASVTDSYCNVTKMIKFQPNFKWSKFQQKILRSLYSNLKHVVKLVYSMYKRVILWLHLHRCFRF